MEVIPDGSLADRTILPIKSSFAIPPLKSQTLTTKLDSGNSAAATLKLFMGTKSNIPDFV